MASGREAGAPGTPRYLAVTGALRAEIAVAPPNTVLPTEQELARRFGVSRLTLRRALGLLERGGLVSRQRRRGTIVSPAKVTCLLAPLDTLEEDFGRQGIKLETPVLSYQPRATPPPEVREALRMARGGRVAALTLLRRAEGRVIVCDRTYVLAAMARGLGAEAAAGRGGRLRGSPGIRGPARVPTPCASVDILRGLRR